MKPSDNSTKTKLFWQLFKSSILTNQTSVHYPKVGWEMLISSLKMVKQLIPLVLNRVKKGKIFFLIFRDNAKTI